MALIYIVEDDVSIREIETIALKNGNYTVQGFGCAAELYRTLDEQLPDMILLDIMLPDEDGYSIVRRLRREARTASIPVMMVTAKTAELDLVRGLDDGADDYIKKPFSVMELLSRVKALLRRTQTKATDRIAIGSIELDNERHAVFADGQPADLTYKEYELLRYLMINRKIVLSRAAIMQAVWGTDYEGETRTVDMHIKTLRQKLGEAGKQIGTVRNVGYVMSEEKAD